MEISKVICIMGTFLCLIGMYLSKDIKYVIINGVVLLANVIITLS